MYIALGDRVVFIEVDEDSHAQYDPSSKLEICFVSGSFCPYTQYKNMAPSRQRNYAILCKALMWTACLSEESIGPDLRTAGVGQLAIQTPHFQHAPPPGRGTNDLDWWPENFPD